MRSLKGNIVCFVVSVHAILMKIRRDNEKSAHERPSLEFSSSGAKIIAKPDINSYLKAFLKYSFKKKKINILTTYLKLTNSRRIVRSVVELH